MDKKVLGQGGAGTSAQPPSEAVKKSDGPGKEAGQAVAAKGEKNGSNKEGSDAPASSPEKPKPSDKQKQNTNEDAPANKDMVKMALKNELLEQRQQVEKEESKNQNRASARSFGKNSKQSNDSAAKR